MPLTPTPVISVPSRSTESREGVVLNSHTYPRTSCPTPHSRSPVLPPDPRLTSPVSSPSPYPLPGRGRRVGTTLTALDWYAKVTNICLSCISAGGTGEVRGGTNVVLPQKFPVALQTVSLYTCLPSSGYGPGDGARREGRRGSARFTGVWWRLQRGRGTLSPVHPCTCACAHYR